MLSCEESFVLGHMVCTSNVTLLHPSHVAVLPAPCFAACAETQGRFENSMITAAASVFPRLHSRDLRQPACRVFLHHSRGRVNLSGWAYECMPPAQTASLESRRRSAVCVLVVYGGCQLHTGIASPSNALRAGAVIITTRDRIELSALGQVGSFESNCVSCKCMCRVAVYDATAHKCHLFLFPPSALHALVCRKTHLQEVAGSTSDADTDGGDGHTCKLIYSNTTVLCYCLFPDSTSISTNQRHSVR